MVAFGRTSCEVVVAGAVLTTTWVGPVPAQAENGPLNRQQAADRVEKLLQDLEQSRSAIPRESFDPQAVVAQVGKDPARLREWVAAHTIWVPYRGMLRGARGALMDRTDNSLDRSLLLAELLRLAGVHSESE